MIHAFTSAVADSGNAALVDGPKWNQVHIEGITALSADTTLGSTHDCIRATGGAGAGITITLPTAVGITGRVYTVKKVDSGVGPVTVATTSSQTIDAYVTYVISNQYQYVKVMSNGTNWDVVGQN